VGASAEEEEALSKLDALINLIEEEESACGEISDED